jgi:hypothetical protein
MNPMYWGPHLLPQLIKAVVCVVPHWQRQEPCQSRHVWCSSTLLLFRWIKPQLSRPNTSLCAILAPTPPLFPPQHPRYPDPTHHLFHAKPTQQLTVENDNQQEAQELGHGGWAQHKHQHKARRLHEAACCPYGVAPGYDILSNRSH